MNNWEKFDDYNLPRDDKQTTKIYSGRENTSNIMIDGIEIPSEVNWNKDGLFTPVKDQMDCNACYAFGAISGLEAHQAIYNKNY